VLTLGHSRWRRRVALLAMDALPAAERPAAERHLIGCARCAEALADMAGVRRLLEADPAAAAEPPVPFETLEARVRARLRVPTPAAPRPGSPWVLAPIAAAAVAIAVTGLVLGGRARRAVPTPEASEAAALSPASEEMLRRMERSLAREQAARYLSEAQDVLVTVAAGPPPCPRGQERVEIEDEVRRSRDLLDRRALVVDTGRDEVASARPVLAEVEEMLTQVAALPSCVRPGRLQALEREIEKRRLLMKIDLMTRELQG
jgi:hypothetical protein